MRLEQLDKNKVLHSFNCAAKSYDSVATVQKKCAKILVNLASKFVCAPKSAQLSILDLGTGTGYVPEFLLPQFPYSYYTLNDIASAMLEQVQQKLKNKARFNFCCGDMETITFNYHDLIISNFALHWVNELYDTIKKFYALTKVFAFTCLTTGTFQEWLQMRQQLCKSPVSLQYPSEHNLIDFLLSLNPQQHSFQTREYSLVFKDTAAFFKYLKNLGATPSKTRIPLFILKELLKNNRQTLTATYKVFFGVISSKAI